MKKYWLIKSEPSEISIDTMQTYPNQTIEWFGIRNYQARNFMRDNMQVGDEAIFWHSSCKHPGIYGIVTIASPAHPDTHQYNPESKYYEPKTTTEKIIWWCVDVKYQATTRYISINELREYPELASMKVLQKGNRLSITPVEANEWLFIQQLLKTN